MGKAIMVLRYRLRTKWIPTLIRMTVCAARGHKLGQIEWYPVSRKGRRWGYLRGCTRCRFEIGCEYEPMRGIYEYEHGFRHDGDLGIDMLMEEAEAAARDGGECPTTKETEA